MSVRCTWIWILAAGLCLVSPQASQAGTISVAWDPVAGATGYEVHVGTRSGDYDQVINVGAATEATVSSLDPCTTYYVAVRGYNGAGFSPLSDEISGGVRPLVETISPSVVRQGDQITVVLQGGMFESGLSVSLHPQNVPVDVDGNPLVRLESYDHVDCRRIDALLSIEPTAAGLRAMQIGSLPLTFDIINPGSVFGRNPTSMTVELDPTRLDINESDSSTRDRVDGKDLTWLAFAYGAREGEARFNADADINGDGLVDGLDLARLAVGFGGCWDGQAWVRDACP